MKKEKDYLYVHGHRNPDTDSIVSAIAYANLKRELGHKAIACRLGPLNEETMYILNRFNVEAPQLLKDARATIKEIDIDEATSVHLDTTVKEAMSILEKKRQTLAVVDDNNSLVGVVTFSNLAKIAMGDTSHSIELLKRTPIENIVKAIEGNLIYKPEVFRYNGKTSVIAIAESKLENYQLQDRLVIVGDDEEAQIMAIEKGAAGLVTVWCEWISERVIEKAKEKGCAVVRSSHGTMNTSRYLLFSPSVRELMVSDLIVFHKDDYVDDVSNRMLQSRFRSYPVVDDQNNIYGFISRYHVLNSKSKRLILVDHNEYSQSVEGVEKAEIVEVIDHHRIGDINTIKPIFFRNEIIGSTASIITKMYRENQVEIPKQIASLLLAALVSDTLNLKSPTTTPQDHEIIKFLGERAQLDHNEFAKDMYGSTSNLSKRSTSEILNQDIKSFKLSGKNVMVSQIVVYRFTELDAIHEHFEVEMERYVQAHALDLLVVVFTSIEQNGSIVVSSGKYKAAAEMAFQSSNGEQSGFMQDVVSRKNQIIPRLSAAIASIVANQ